VTNQGSATGTNIRVEAILPPEHTFVSADGLVTATLSGAKVTFAPLAALAPGARAEFRVVITGSSPADSRFTVTMISDQMTSPVQETESTHIYE
jgi:hypothetical protein